MYCGQVKLAGLFGFIVLCLAEGCTQCGGQSSLTENSLSIEELKQVRIELIKKQILKKLRLSKPPSETRRFTVPNVITDEDGVLGELKKVSEDDKDDYYATTQNVIVFAEEISTKRSNDSSVFSTTMRFLASSATEFLQGISSAHLWIYRNQQNTSRVTYILYTVPLNNSALEREVILDVDHLTKTSPSDWCKYDITTLLNNQKSKDSRITLSIDCHGCEKDLIGTDEKLQPFVVIGYNISKNLQRNKRHIECFTNTNHCCRQDFYLSFEEIGWNDTIVYPRGYKANFCHGYCGFDVSLSKYPHSAIMQNVMQGQMHGSINRNVTVELCCSPYKMSGITVIFGNESVLYSTYVPNMVVEACNCS